MKTNSQLTLLLSVSLFLLAAPGKTSAQTTFPEPEKMTPAMSEFWNPQPRVVAAADYPADWIIPAPSDAEVLFDGKTLDEWRAQGGAEMEPAAGWSVEDNCMKVKWDAAAGREKNRNIITKREFADFEFSIEWKLSAASNSGIIYHYGDEFTEAPACTGPEYQIIDDTGWPVELTEDHFTGVDYEMHMPDKTKKRLNPVGEFNHSKIVFRGGHVEHWLNGQKILEFEAWTPDWYARLEKSRWKTARCYGRNESGAFMLQNYRDCEIWFKNIKVRSL